MKIMVFGDTASGKSTFAKSAGKKLSIPVIHLDEVMDGLGRLNKASIGDYIRREADKDEWIIEGNAFTKDRDYRITRADLIVVFDANPFTTLGRHVMRYLRLKTGREKRVGSSDTKLNLGYYLPYFFFKFPPRKKRAIEAAHSQGKKPVFIINRMQAKRLLRELEL